MAALADLPARLRAVREAHEMTQLQFLPLLNREAARRGVREYSQSTLSRLESGRQEATFDDVAVFAALDPQHRGKLWLGWGETTDLTLRQPRHGPSIIQQNEPAVFEVPTIPEKKPARKKRA